MSGLAFAQAPPPSVPMRFLATALAWGVVAGGGLAWHGEAALLSRWTPATLVLVHMFALGLLGNAMLGSLVQFLPVAAGSPLPGTRVVPWLHAAFNAGLALLLATLAVSSHALALPAAGLLGGSLAIFALLALVAVIRGKGGVLRAKADMVSAGFSADGFYPEIRAQQVQMTGAMAEFMTDTPMYKSYVAVAPKPEDFANLVQGMGDLMREIEVRLLHDRGVWKVPFGNLARNAACSVHQVVRCVNRPNEASIKRFIRIEDPSGHAPFERGLHARQPQQCFQSRYRGTAPLFFQATRHCSAAVGLSVPGWA